jgi:glycosyltransferase involved in cell wall biosynthesis
MELKNNKMKVSFIIPVYNNFDYTLHIYQNLKEYYPEDEIVISDGGSTDQTINYFSNLKDPNLIFLNNGKMSLCQNYNRGVEMSTQDIVILLHNDMFIPPNFKDKLLVDLTETSIVSFSRIEPSIFPGEEPGKIVRDFGYSTLDLDKDAVIKFSNEYTKKYAGGGYLFIACYKKNYLKLDDVTYNPPQGWCADDDLHVRYILSNLDRIISDACVYHFVSKTSRKDNYQQIEQYSNKNFIRKWGFRNSIHNKKYNKAFIIHDCSLQGLELLEPWCDRIYINNDNVINEYINSESNNTSFDLTKRVLNINKNEPYSENDIIVEFNIQHFNQNSFNIIQNLSDIISESGTIGQFELDSFNITIRQIKDYSNELIYLSDNNR